MENLDLTDISFKSTYSDTELEILQQSTDKMIKLIPHEKLIELVMKLDFPSKFSIVKLDAYSKIDKKELNTILAFDRLERHLKSMK